MKFPVVLLFLSLCASAFSADEEGYASWYAGKFQGRITASGEVFDTNQMTAAHKTLPFGTLVRVTNTTNDRTVDVRINDRGPFVEGRIIDLSRAAAEALDMTRSGIAYVSVDVLSTPDIRVSIQIAAYSLEENALRAAKALVEAGFPAVLERAGTIHRIVLQNLSESEARTLLTRVKAAGYPSAFIRQKG